MLDRDWILQIDDPPTLIDPVLGDCSCPKGYAPAYSDNGSCSCQQVILGPPQMYCEPPLVHKWNADGSQSCVDPAFLGGPGTGVITSTPGPSVPLCYLPDGTITHCGTSPAGTTVVPAPGTTPTPVNPNHIEPGIFDGILGEDGTIFGFSPWMLGAVAIGAFFVFGSGGKK